MAAGEFIWRAALGFLLTGVGLPLLTVVALARVGGGMDRLTAPLGKFAGTVLAVAVYLAIGPLFATPRTAVVSFEMGIAPFSGNSGMPLFIYTLVFFAAMLFLVLNPGQLVNRIGKFITPVLLAALLVLGGAAIFAPAGEVGAVNESYRGAPLIKGFLEGYLTMDTLGALVFGIVIATAIRDRGVTEPALVTRYSMIAGVIAAIGLSLVYLALFYLGHQPGYRRRSGERRADPDHLCAAHLRDAGQPAAGCGHHPRVPDHRGGLTTACGEFFSALLPVSYRSVVIVFALFSLLVANQG